MCGLLLVERDRELHGNPPDASWWGGAWWERDSAAGTSGVLITVDSTDRPTTNSLYARHDRRIKRRSNGDVASMRQAYVDWARRFTLFHGKRHPRGLGRPRLAPSSTRV